MCKVSFWLTPCCFIWFNRNIPSFCHDLVLFFSVLFSLNTVFHWFNMLINLQKFVLIFWPVIKVICLAHSCNHVYDVIYPQIQNYSLASSPGPTHCPSLSCKTLTDVAHEALAAARASCLIKIQSYFWVSLPVSLHPATYILLRCTSKPDKPHPYHSSSAILTYLSCDPTIPSMLSYYTFPAILLYLPYHPTIPPLPHPTMPHLTLPLPTRGLPCQLVLICFSSS